METYDGILGRMVQEYEAKSGCKVEDVSDIGLRLRVLAGEVYRALGQVEWLRQQAFPQTARGEALDRHGAQWGLARQEARKAQGTMTFSRYIPLVFDVLIPAGTLCAAAGEEAVEYVTTQDAVLAAGELTVAAPAQAVEPGAKGNAAAGFINTMVTPVSGVQYASNRSAFTGGADAEDDESFRARILGRFRDPAPVGSAGYYEGLALGHPGVTAAQAVPAEDGPGTVGVYVWGQEAAPSEETLAQLAQLLDTRRELGIAVAVKAAQSKKVNLAVRIAPQEGADFDTLKAQGQEALKAWVDSLGVGQGVTQAELTRFILDRLPVDKIEFLTNGSSYTGAPGVKPVAGTMAIQKIA